MKQLGALIWKEWHDVRWFLAVALLLFIGMPCIGAIENRFTYSTGFDFNASPWVIPLGGFLAILTAIGITCSDLGNRLEDFWRSRAINPLRWILIKYLVGLGVVLISCIAPLLLELQIGNLRSSTFGTLSIDNRIDLGTIILFTALWIVLYSIAFLCGCVIRRTAHATMLALAGMLLIYFLPMVLPFMNWLSIDAQPEWLMNSDRLQSMLGIPIRMRYTGGMLAIAATALVLSLIAIKRNWKIVSGTRMMYWSIGSTLVLLFSTAAFQLGTNLPVQQQFNLPAGQHVDLVQFDGARGMIITRADQIKAEHSPQPSVQLIDLKDGRLALGPPIKLPPESLAYGRQSCALRGHVLYSVFQQALMDKTVKSELRVTNLDGPLDARSVAMVHSVNPFFAIFLRDQRLFMLMGDKVAVFDIHVPTDPRLMSEAKVAWGMVGDRASVSQGICTKFQYRLPLIPGLSDRERLEIILREPPYVRTLVGNVMVAAFEGGLLANKLDQFKDGGAYFTLVGRYQPSFLLERIFGNTQSEVVGTERAVYVSQKNNVPGKDMEGITVFGIDDPAHPRPIAHFAVPSTHPLVVEPLPDGRAIVGGDQLFLLGKPPM